MSLASDKMYMFDKYAAVRMSVVSNIMKPKESSFSVHAGDNVDI